MAPELQPPVWLYLTKASKQGGPVKLGRISARNVIAGKVVDVKKGAVAAQVRVDIGGGNIVTSSITVDSVDNLALRPGSDVAVIIKASSVLLGVAE